MVSQGMRWLRLGGLCGVVVLLTLSLQLSQRAVAQTPSSGGVHSQASRLTSVSASLRSVKRAGQPQPSTPFLHPGGKAKLDQEKADALKLAPGAGIRAAALATPEPLEAAAGTAFDGINYANSNGSATSCGCYPPDGAVAAGPNQVVAVVNTAIEIWNKSGAVLLGPISLASALQQNPNCLTYVTDPFVRYDAAAGRWVFGALSYDLFYDSALCFGVSETSDPTGVYRFYAPSSSTAEVLLDFPQFAVGTNSFFTSTNQFQCSIFTGCTTFLGPQVCAYNKSDMYTGGSTTPVCLSNIPNNAAGNQADTLYPAQAVATPNTMYFLSADNCNNCSTISVYKWANPFASSTPPITLQGGVTVTSYSQPPSALQMGSSTPLDTNDVRDLGAYWYAGTIYGAHAIGCNPGSGTVACVQWYQAGNLDGSPSLLQQGTIAGNGQDRFFPQLAVDSAGDMTIGYAFSSPTDFAGILYTGRSLSDPAGTVQAESSFKAGQTSVDCPGGCPAGTASVRYGDFAGEALDPSDQCTIWHFEEYAESGQPWGTWMASARFSGCGASTASASATNSTVAASPTSVPADNSTASTITVTLKDASGNAVGGKTVTLAQGSGHSTITPPSATSNGSGVASFSATDGTPEAVTYTATDTTDTVTVTQTATVTFTTPPPAPDFSLSCNPSSLSGSRNSRQTSTCTVTSANGFNAAVSLACANLPAGVSCSYSPNPVTPPANGSVTSTLTVRIGSRARTGTYTFRANGSSSSLAHSFSMQLAVH